MSEDDEEQEVQHKSNDFLNVWVCKTICSGVIGWKDEALMRSGDPQYDMLLAQAVTTLPSTAALSSLNLDIQSNEDQVTVSWSVPAEIA